MTTKQLRDILHAKPFQPFLIHLTDGDVLKVEHPELLNISPGGRTAILWTDEERFQIFDVLLVTKLTNMANGDSLRESA